MTEGDFAKSADFGSDEGPPGTSSGSIPGSGDPSLELFSHGWLPASERTKNSDSYTGRHRAPDGIEEV
jgi:hypothetical protein